MHYNLVSPLQHYQKELALKYEALIRQLLTGADLPELCALKWAMPSSDALVCEIRFLADRLALINEGEFAMNLQEEAADQWVETADLAGRLEPDADEQLDGDE